MNHRSDDEGNCWVDGEGWPCAADRAWFDYKLAFNREFPDAGGPVLGHRAFMAGRASVEAERDALRAQLDGGEKHFETRGNGKVYTRLVGPWVEVTD